MTTKTKVILAFALIFLIGFASGYVFNRAVTPSGEIVTEERSDRGERARQHNEDRREWIERAQNRLSRDLELTDSQKDPLFEKVHQYHVDVRSLIQERREDEHEMIKEKYSTFREEIASILDPEQLERMDSHFHPDTVRAKMDNGQHRQRRGRN
jgi:hypothetical protein